MTSSRAGDIPAGYDGSRPLVRSLVPQQARRILDVGCARGAVGAALKSERDGTEVVGIELDESFGREAALVLDEVIVGDAEDVLEGSANLDRLDRFDCAIAADVLEHMVHPENALAALAGLVAEDGLLVVSVPNVRHWSVLFEVFVRGSWPRRSAGIFDRTHLRWFTRSDLEELLAGAGLQAERWIAVGGGASWRRPIMWCLERSPLQGFFARQYVVAARARGSR